MATDTVSVAARKFLSLQQLPQDKDHPPLHQTAERNKPHCFRKMFSIPSVTVWLCSDINFFGSSTGWYFLIVLII